MTSSRQGRYHLRVSVSAEALIAWGYHSCRCDVTEFSTHGLTVTGMSAPVDTPVSIQLSLAEGTFTLCGVVVHREGQAGAAGIRFLALTPSLLFDLDLYFWNLLAAECLPDDERSCSIVGCDRPRKARGLCSLHYSRWRRKQPAGSAGSGKQA